MRRNLYTFLVSHQASIFVPYAFGPKLCIVPWLICVHMAYIKTMTLIPPYVCILCIRRVFIRDSGPYLVVVEKRQKKPLSHDIDNGGVNKGTRLDE